jgi:hypothetical protein
MLSFQSPALLMQRSFLEANPLDDGETVQLAVVKTSRPLAVTVHAMF